MVARRDSRADLSKKVNGSNTKKNTETLNTKTAAASGGGATDQESAAAAVSLCEQGFDRTAAETLARARPLDVIRKQVEWLPKRGARKPLAVLRRAIEDNWGQPEEPQDGNPAAASFVRNYYAAYHGNGGSLVPNRFAGDLTATGDFLASQGVGSDQEAVAAEWGMEFGGLVRGHQKGQRNAQPFLKSALVLYGNDFAAGRRRKDSEQNKAALEVARVAHGKRFKAQWVAYLEQRERECEHCAPEVYSKFQAELARRSGESGQRNVRT